MLSLKEHIKLVGDLGLSATPELKGTDEEIGFDGVNLTQESYARKAIKEYISAGISPNRVWPQSFQLRRRQALAPGSIRSSGKQAVFLVDGDDSANPLVPIEDLSEYRKQGLNIVAPAMPILLTVDANNKDGPIGLRQGSQALGARYHFLVTRAFGPHQRGRVEPRQEERQPSTMQRPPPLSRTMATS